MLKVGDVIEKFDGPITRKMIQNYGKASGDRNPIHMNDMIAEKFGLKGVIAHGMLGFGLGVRHVNDLALDENGNMFNVGCEMRGMLRPGDWLITTITVEEVVDNEITISFIQDSKMPLKLEKDGEIVKKYEGEEKEWVKEKEISGIATEETSEGILTYRRWLVNKGWAKIRLSS